MKATIERVARAMCEADGFDPDTDIRQLKSGKILDFTINGSPERWRLYTNKARAAIKAMRIPSTEAINAGGQVCSQGPVHALEIWEAMVDMELRDQQS